MRIVSVVMLAAALAACGPNAKFPTIDGVEAVVLKGVEGGEGIEQIELDVTSYIAAQAGIDPVAAVDVVKAVQDALDALIDFGLIKSPLRAKALEMRDFEHAKLTLREGK